MTIQRSHNPIVDKSLEFSLSVISFCDELDEERKYVVSKQLLKSATSIGANVREAQNAESKADFIHKMKIALKECEETDYWLLLCEKADSYPNPNGLAQKNTELWKLLTSIVSSSKRKSTIS